MGAALLLATLPAIAIADPAPQPAAALSDGRGPAERVSFAGYLTQVGQGNLELAAQRSTVSVARAQIAIARVFPDPVVTAGLQQIDISGRGNPTASIVQLTVPLQIGGQRGARIALAEANGSASEADLEEFLRGLRAAAASSYVDALRARLVLDRKRRTLESLQKLESVNEQRLKSGDIGEATVLQSRVEANQSRAEVLDSEGLVQTADLALVQLLGSGARALLGRPLEVEGDLSGAAGRSFLAPNLVSKALAQRPDLIAIKRRLTASARQIDLAEANRVIDIGLGASWQHNLPVGSIQPALPSSDFIGATVSVPIPFSRLYRGELDAAYATQQQVDALVASAKVRIEVEVREAIARYDAAAARVRLYTGGVLADADQVLEKTLYNYRRGGATLVEVLVAQRTDNDVYLSYYDALSDAAHALIAVQQASASWDVNF
jgi:cobalt-zinc-cadmium efflux system outer membrane protein